MPRPTTEAACRAAEACNAAIAAHAKAFETMRLAPCRIGRGADDPQEIANQALAEIGALLKGCER